MANSLEVPCISFEAGNSNLKMRQFSTPKFYLRHIKFTTKCLLLAIEMDNELGSRANVQHGWRPRGVVVYVLRNCIVPCAISRDIGSTAHAYTSPAVQSSNPVQWSSPAIGYTLLILNAGH